MTTKKKMWYKMRRMLRVGVICGGLSKERGISLNSARSFLDHTSSLEIDLVILYVNREGVFYRLSAGQLYSNTPADFDFKLDRMTRSLSEEELVSVLQGVELVFPLIHGAYGEGGTLQRFLESHHIPFVGSAGRVCEKVFNKWQAKIAFAEKGFATLPALRIGGKGALIAPFWLQHQLTRAIVKPAESGSSLGVTYVDSIESAEGAVERLWDEGFKELLLEPYAEHLEFTICVLEGHLEKAVSLLPIEIDIGEGVILDYRKKYLPNDETRYYCPPRVAFERIRKEAEGLFEALELRDFARIDGWLSKEGIVYFSDLNPISGMEQNSFLFQGASRAGLSHADLIEYVLKKALKRIGKEGALRRRNEVVSRKEPIYVLLGGETAERQVSLMTGTNVWLKLCQEGLYDPVPFLLDWDQNVWQLPYAEALHHTVEEILEHCQREKIETDFAQEIRSRLGLSEPLADAQLEKMTLLAFLEKAKANRAFVFLGLHGGIGEDGTLQKLLEERGIPFNGSNAAVSHLCMDKRRTAEAIFALKDPSLLPMPQIAFEGFDPKGLWERALSSFQTNDLLIKPRCDGCSAGVVRLASEEELTLYLDGCRKGVRSFSVGTFLHQHGPVEMPLNSSGFLLEPFIFTDKISLRENRLHHERVSGLVEMTIGVLERRGVYTAFSPSITVAESHVLSLEEKFQGGTGMNVTPPPLEILSERARFEVERGAERAAKGLGVRNYVRLDLFVECETGKIQLIEANTLPALTPSTVLFHQAWNSTKPLSPKDFLKTIIENAKLKIEE